MLSKKIKLFTVPALLLLLLFISVILLTNALIQRPYVQSFLIKTISDFSGYDIQTGEIELNLWRGIGIYVKDFKARSRRGYENISASRVRIILDAMELVKGRIKPVSLYLFQPKIEISLKDRSVPIELESDTEPKRKGVPPLFWIPGLESLLVEKGQVSIIDRPFDLEDLHLDVRQKSLDPVTLGVNANGKIWFRGEGISFDLKGNVFPSSDEGIYPSVDITLETGKAPLHWITLPKSFSIKDGDFKTRLKINGNPERHTSINGEIIIEPLCFVFSSHDREKDYSLPNLTLDFQSVLKGKTISVPSLKMKSADLSLSVAIRLDMKEKESPFLELTIKSDFMTINTLKNLFPSPLLPPWLENRLFPILNAGNVRLKLLALKGSIEQLQDLSENRSALTMMFECQDLKVSGDGIQLPFEEVFAEVNFENGDFHVSDLRANFGDSKIKHASLDVRDVYSHYPRFEISMDGSFDLHGLMRQKEMNVIPSDVRLDLDRVRELSGSLECRARFGYEHGWDFPRILDGKFVFRDCLLKQRELFLPLALKEVEILFNEKNNNRLRSVGSWGDSRFKTMWSFGITGKRFDIRRIYISADTDMNQVISVIYQGYELPVEFGGPAACRITAVKKKDYWSCQGQVDLQDMALKTNGLSIDPPGTQKDILFDLGLRPRERIDLNNILCRFNGSALELSGSYDLKTGDTFDLNLSSPGFSLEDLGIRFKKKGAPARGTLKGNVKMRLSSRKAADTTMTGQIKGEDLFLDLRMFPSPIKECNVGLSLSGKKVTIALWKMKVGESPVYIMGDLKGWDGLKGEITVKSDFLDFSDILPSEDSSLLSDKKTGPGSFMKMLDIHVRLDVLRGQWRKLRYGPLNADLDLRQGDLFIKRSKIDMEHGVLTVKGHVKTRKDPELLFSGHIRLTDQPVHDLLKSIPSGYKDLKGSLSLEALFFMKGKEKRDLISSLTGTAAISIKKGLIRNSRVFIKVLDFLSPQKTFKQRPPDLREEGLYFESIQGDAVIDQGILRSENFVMKSPVFNAVGYGKTDMARKTVDFVLGTQPHGTFDALVRIIPILGHIFIGENGSLLTYTFEVKGPMSGPTVNFVPFKNLGKGIAGIFRRLFLPSVKILGNHNGASQNLWKDAE